MNSRDFTLTSRLVAIVQPMAKTLGFGLHASHTKHATDPCDGTLVALHFACRVCQRPLAAEHLTPSRVELQKGVDTAADFFRIAMSRHQQEHAREP